MAADEAWVKTMPRAIAEGLTGGRSIRESYQHTDASSRDEIVDMTYRATTVGNGGHTVKSSHCEWSVLCGFVCGRGFTGVILDGIRILVWEQ